MKTLLVIDMQNDFINGALGTKEAEAIVPFVKDKIKEYREAGNPVFLLMHFRCAAGYVASFFFQSIALPKALVLPPTSHAQRESMPPRRLPMHMVLAKA